VNSEEKKKQLEFVSLKNMFRVWESKWRQVKSLNFKHKLLLHSTDTWWWPNSDVGENLCQIWILGIQFIIKSSEFVFNALYEKKID
jgi:hypothetical protein